MAPLPTILKPGKVLQVVQHPADILRKVANPLDNVNKALTDLAKDMTATMNKHEAFGLSAPQVNVPVRMIVIHPRCGCKYSPLINPVILEVNQITTVEPEGCLSVQYGKPTFMVRRAKSLRMWAYDLNMRELYLEVFGKASRVIQHEIDHLDGKLVLDYAEILRG